MHETLAFIVSFIAMVLIAASYFFKEKEKYLLFQLIGIVFLMLSYFFTGAFFAMIGLGIAIMRTLVFFLYEKKGKTAPLWIAFLFCGLSALAYFIVNFGILQTAKPNDIIYLLALFGYAFVFRIRNIKIVRFTVLIPTVLSIVYNVAIGAVPFVIISYTFELGANIVSIFKYHVFNKKNKTQGV